MTTETGSYSLVADVGGTNTRVALAQDAKVLIETLCRFKNSDHAGLSDIISQFLSTHDQEISAACIAMAGLIRGGHAEMTNLSWEFGEDDLQNATGVAHGEIINDLQAQAYAIGHTSPNDQVKLIEGTLELPNSTQLVIGLGTGVNLAPLFVTSSGSLSTPAEVGHASFTPMIKLDFELSLYLSENLGFASIEEVLSGRGLENVYAFHSDRAAFPPKIGAADVMKRVSQKDELACQAFDQYARCLGQFCGDMALTHLPYSGIYLVGGVARSVAPFLSSFGFAEGFRSKGRFESFLGEFSVSLIQDDFAALKGCAARLASTEHS